jgi:guanyl-specific ribonuclease Sa
MKNKLKSLNFILTVLLVLVLGTGCGRQKAIELPTSDEAVVAVSEAAGDKTASSIDESQTSENKADSFDDASDISGLSELGGTEPGGTESEEVVTSVIFEDGVYTSKEDVARYISEFGHLPQNFITKKEAQALGWPGGSLEKYAPGKCIGGDRFGNYEGLLPEEKGRKYYECDIDTLGKDKRGAKRIIYSNDGLIFYTDDHYKSFTQLYGLEFDD